MRAAAAGAQPRLRTDYRRLARDILAHPAWAAAAGSPEKIRRRVLSRLIDSALAEPAPSGVRIGSVQR